MKHGLIACALLSTAIPFAGCHISGGQECLAPGGIVFPHKWVGQIDRSKFNEPSGIVYHPIRGTLFVVGDEGDLCEMTGKGVLVKKKLSDRRGPAGQRPDYEGITCDPATGLLYVAVEGQETIIEVDPETFETKRTFRLERVLNGKTLMKKGGQGIEGITFVPDPQHPEGGTFYVAHQSFTLENPGEVSGILEVELPLRTASHDDPRGKTLRCFSLGVIDLSGLHYDKATDRVYVISDATNTLWEITRQGRIVRRYAFPGDSQEGIAVDPGGYVYIAQDSGGILKIEWLRR